jgi:hypothetical protein
LVGRGQTLVEFARHTLKQAQTEFVGITFELCVFKIRVHDAALDAVVSRFRKRLEDSTGDMVAEIDEVTPLWRRAAGEDGPGNTV